MSSTGLEPAKTVGVFAMAREGIAAVVAEKEVRVGDCWYVSCFQRGFTIRRIAGVYAGPNDPQIGQK